MQKSSFSIDNTLSNLQIETLNEMQQASLEANKTSNALVLLTDTGSGKTLTSFKTSQVLTLKEI